jgi:CelD/BcsL family acetyltransferase involved in cellulose biosynthesis
MGSGMALLAQPLVGASDEDAASAASDGARARLEIGVSITNVIEDVEQVWRALEAKGVESPGQSYDFIRLWVRDRAIAPTDQVYVVGHADGVPVALMALHRRRVRGIRVLTWFPGTHVGCHAPVADYALLAGMAAEQRKALWDAMTGALSGADLIYLRSIPLDVAGRPGLFEELGTTLAVDVLYRAQFSSWEACDRVQRSKSRRKHDRQQGDRLEAMGAVSFEDIGNGGDSRCAIETMFKQRSARFKAMGIRDTFVRDGLVSFYHDAIKPGSGIEVRLHVLRLNGEIVATRYNVVHGSRMFCLISSMSDDPAIQGGSPGKQCLLRVMQTVFDAGYSVFDMGAGFTDEKRHWCNVQVPLRHHYVPLTVVGRVVLAAHQGIQTVRARIKANKGLMSLRRLPARVMERFGRKAKGGDGH